jgi:hypothetical protein
MCENVLKIRSFCPGTAILHELDLRVAEVRSVKTQSHVSTHRMWQPLPGDHRGETRLATHCAGRVSRIELPYKVALKEGACQEGQPERKPKPSPTLANHSAATSKGRKAIHPPASGS